MENQIEPKQVVPVVAGNTRILLSVPEWAISIMIFAAYMSFSGNLVWFFLIIQIIITLVYVLFLSKLEENIINVLIRAAKMPNIVCGSFNKPMPLDKREGRDDVFKISKE